jgi:hypothetical protein
MSKLYPFKYRFENPGILPLKDDLWFESHQELLLRIVNTPQGRDLLCIDKSFDGIEIVKFGKNHVTGFFGLDGEKARLVSDFRAGAKWANIIRFRWRDFVALAREHYSDKVNGQTEILLNGRYGMAATTSTFYPDPHPETTTVDGWVERLNAAGETLSAIIAGSGTFALSTSNSENAPMLRGDGNTDKYDELIRAIYGFDTSIIGVDTISSAIFSRFFLSKDNGLLGEDSDNSKSVLSAVTPNSNTNLISSDYGQFQGTDFGRSAKQVDISADYNDIALNANGIAGINTSGVTNLGARLGWDFDDTETGLTWAGPGIIQAVEYYFADQAGTDFDPRLVVEHNGGVVKVSGMFGIGKAGLR